jgi:hypothetical protein
VYLAQQSNETMNGINDFEHLYLSRTPELRAQRFNNQKFIMIMTLLSLSRLQFQFATAPQRRARPQLLRSMKFNFIGLPFASQNSKRHNKFQTREDELLSEIHNII